MKRKWAPAFSIGKQARLPNYTTLAPGPAHYSPSQKSTRLTSPRYSVGKVRRYKKPKKDKRPGPATYTVEYKGKHSPCARISTGRKKERTEKTPGPQTYSPEKNHKNLSYTMSRKRSIGKTNGIPGPGAHEIADIAPSSPRFAFGRQKRDNSDPNISFPGPGQYNSRSRFEGPRYSVPKTNRTRRLDKRPGPDAYDTSNSNTVLKRRPASARIVPRRKFQEKSRSQGPAEYDIAGDMSKSSKPSYSIPKDEVFISSSSKSMMEGPAPDLYSPRSQDTQSRAFIGKALRAGIVDPNSNPGPGQHDPVSLSFDGPSYTIRTKNPVKETKFVPGPGQYKQDVREEPKFPIGKSRRMPSYDTAVPGVGRYSIEGTITQPKQPQYSFPKCRSIDAVRSEPGPSDYVIPSEIGYLPRYASLNST